MENKETGLQISQPNALLSQVELDFSNKVQTILDVTKNIAFQQNPIAKGLMCANAMERINELITPELMKPVEKLFGSSIGIKTDKQYPAETMKRIFIEATLGGWGIIGNQVNVLGANLYITKNGYLPRLRSFPGLKFTFPFKHQLPVQDPKHLTWSVTSEILYELNGVKHSIVITNPTKKQEGQSADALLGKADTKCCRWLWNKVTGEDTMDDSGGSEEFVDAEITSGANVGQGEKVNLVEVKEKASESNSTASNKVTKEFQDKFDTYISKVASVSLDQLIGRAKTWCDSPVAISAGATYSLDGSVFNSNTLDLTVFNSLALKIVQG